MSVEDFVWHREFLELLEDDEALLEALHGEVLLHRVKCHYFEKRYDYPMSATPDVLEVARRANSWMAVYDWRRALYAVQYDGMSYEEIQRALAARAAGYSGGMPLGAKITSDAAASRWLNGERAYLHVQGRTLEEPSLSLRREPMFVELDRESRFTLKEMTVETVGDIFREIGDEIGAKPGASGVNSGRRNSGVAVSKGCDKNGWSQLQAKKQFAHKARSGVSTFETTYDDGSNTTDTGALQMGRRPVDLEGLRSMSQTVVPELVSCRLWSDLSSTEQERLLKSDVRRERLVQLVKARKGRPRSGVSKREYDASRHSGAQNPIGGRGQRIEAP